MAVRVLGVDPGFRNLGLFGLRLTGIGSISASFAKVITTKKVNKKHRILEADDEIRCLEEIERAFKDALSTFMPDVVITEERPKLRSNQATAVVAMAFAALHAITRANGIPFIVVSIPDIKLCVTGDRSASKADMVKALKGKFPGFKGWPDSARVEHVADAGGAALCAQRHPVVEMLLRERAN